MTETTTPGSEPSPDGDPPSGGNSVMAPLRRTRVRRIVGAQFLAETGDGISLVALPVYVWDRTGSELYTSLTFAAEMGLGAVGAIVGGILADAFDRQRVLLTSYVVRAVLLLAAFAVDPLLAAVAFGVLARAGGQADNPSFDALIPGQADGDLQQLLALRRLIQGVSISIGPAVGALIIAVIGPRAGLAVNAVTFAVAFVIMRTMRGVDTDIDQRRADRGNQPAADVVADVVRGARAILAAPGLARFVFYLALVMASVGIVQAAALVWYERDLEVGGYWYGLAIAGYGMGSILGLVWAGRRTFVWPLPRIALVAAPIYAVACGISAVVEQPWMLPLGWLLWGLALGPEVVVSELFIVGSVPESGRGRAYATIGLALTIGSAVGFAVAGPLLDSYAAASVIIGTAGLVLLTGLLWVLPTIRNEPHWRTTGDMG
ncbi:MAG: MFS transporter [Actinomycetota bacterium]